MPIHENERKSDMFFPCELKFTDDSEPGSFEGYGAVFGNVDSYGDVIKKGAFRETLKEWTAKKRLPPMLAQHGGFMNAMDMVPIGKWDEMSEDDNGLYVKGRIINLDTERGKTIYGAMKEGALSGMSIGYRAKEFEIGTKPDEPRRILKKLELIELSVVTMPANDMARVASMKSAAENITTIREFEEFLRDAGGFSRQAAKAIASGGFKETEHRDGADEDSDIAAMLRGNIDKIKQSLTKESRNAERR